ncbi:helicase-related protein [uncultured Thomasclavelia sp.]|uniref:helicase-related protein n=1 Tax=uncultured Thomasclavelia sp. TaxID=3025759 RepID=UPI0026341327|nr:helicase-related protein [uncultured Thomasclavelia sp.]
MICPRCKNQDPKYFYTFNQITYCRKCINVGSKQIVKNSFNLPKAKIDYYLDYQLTPLQQKISKDLLNRYINNKNTNLKAVCGAGKTEITYEVIKYALNNNHCVCFTTPRKELVIELANRIQSQFSNIDITCVYGGHTKITSGQFIICTTHQLYRYPNTFDLLILDELDAFPYANNDVLQSILENSIKGNYIYMSATMNDNPDLLMTKRYHGHLLDIPKCYITPNWLAYIIAVFKIKANVKNSKPTIVFVPSIKQTYKCTKIFKLFKLKCLECSSKTTKIEKRLAALKNGKLDVIVATTILERGITVDNVQVIVLQGNNRVFNQSTLIQICGRVGRNINHPNGSISIFTPYKTKAIKKCISTIKQDNA